MMAVTLWKLEDSDRLLKDSSGDVVQCEECPCEESPQPSLCRLCDVGADEMYVHIAGMVNDNCATCANLNGNNYVVDFDFSIENPGGDFGQSVVVCQWSTALNDCGFTRLVADISVHTGSLPSIWRVYTLIKLEGPGLISHVWRDFINPAGDFNYDYDCAAHDDTPVARLEVFGPNQCTDAGTARLTGFTI